MKIVPGIRLRSAMMIFVLGLLSTALRAEKPFACADTPGQLPKTVVPRHYTLHFTPNLDKRWVAGMARIEVEVLQPVRALVLNALELDITSAGIDEGDGVLKPILDAAKQTL